MKKDSWSEGDKVLLFMWVLITVSVISAGIWISQYFCGYDTEQAMVWTIVSGSIAIGALLISSVLRD